MGLASRHRQRDMNYNEIEKVPAGDFDRWELDAMNDDTAEERGSFVKNTDIGNTDTGNTNAETADAGNTDTENVRPEDTVGEIPELSESDAGDTRTEEEAVSGKKSKTWLRGFFWGILAAAAAFILFVNVPFGPAVTRPDSLLTYKKLVQARRTIERHFNGEVDDQELEDFVFMGLIAGLEDKYAAYYTKEEYEQLSNTQQGHYTGIGVNISLRTEDGAIVVTNVVEGGPADEAGILAEDVIRAINGTETEGLTTSEVVDLVGEAEEDEIVLRIYRESEDREFEVTAVRRELDTISVKGKMVTDDIGLIQISSFNGLTASQFRETLDELLEEGASSLIFDLRDNLGGLVTAVRDTLREIMPEGVLVYTVDKYGNREDIECDGKNELDLPMAVLVNGNTASAAEIFSGALQDYEKAEIVGTQTYGKGIVQDVYTLFDGSVIRLTVKHYYTPDGNDIHEKGITPDVKVEADPEAPDVDEQLEEAVRILSGN